MVIARESVVRQTTEAISIIAKKLDRHVVPSGLLAMTVLDYFWDHFL